MNSVLYGEASLLKIETSAWIFSYWVQGLPFFSASLTPLIMANSFQSFGCQTICAKPQLYGFSWPAIALKGYDHTVAYFKQWAIDLELQTYPFYQGTS